jgi:DNA (cytosine-5)-methyltransferase 1
MMKLTLGSLFDGIGGFPLAGQRNGIKAIWASEIEPFPIKVSSIRFPDMKHKGDITQIDTSTLEPVDIVTGGSPCQDLSVAGKRAGLAGKRSGLFMEQVRIVREMREHEKSNGRTGINIRPRFMVWENVPGAFSSNKGEDFRAVLEETARITDETIVIPGPAKGKWSTVGCIMGNGWSIAWRVLDAQYWGVPQRRRRIFLVADFGGQSAPEVLFKHKGLSRHTQESGEAREGTASDAERSVGKAIYDCRGNGDGGVSCTIAGDHQNRVTDFTAVAVIPINDKATRHMGGGQSRNHDGSGNGLGVGKPGDPCPTLTKGDKHGIAVLPFNATQITSPANGNNPKYGDPCHPLCATDYAPHIVQKIDCQPSGIAGTVSRKWAKGTGGPAGDEHYNLVTVPYPTDVAHCLSKQPQLRHRDDMDNLVVAGCDFRNDKENGDLCGTLQAKSTGGQSLNCIHPVRIGYSVRRLTPLECERLQDYPDGWTDITWTVTNKKGKVQTVRAKDGPRYKAEGNSVAVCCVEYVLEGIKEVLERSL